MMTNMMPLGEVVSIKGGGTPSRKVEEYWNGEIPWATVKDLKGTTLSGTEEAITLEAVGKSATQIIPAGNIIIATRMALGKAAINIVDLAINQDLKALTCNGKIDACYLLHFLCSKASFLEGSGKGATVKGITLDVVKNLEIPLPPLPEQRRIAAILDKADAIRRKRQQAIGLTEEFLRSVFLDMFGDPFLNPKGWEVKKLGEIGSLDRGVSKHRPRNAPELLGGMHPLIQTGDVSNSDGYIIAYKSTYSDLGLKQSKMWPAGSLCITIAANIARTGILTFDACFPDSVVGFSPNDQATTEYVQYWIGFLQKILERNAPESAQKNINLAILRGLDVPTPPVALQEKFSMVVKSALEMRGNQSHGSKGVENVFNSLVQRAFRGDL